MWGLDFNADATLPADWRSGSFLGRLDFGQGPTPVLVQQGQVFDVSGIAATCAQFAALWVVGGPLAQGRALGPLAELGLSSKAGAAVRVLSPVDLQCIKAAGVTFADSALERVIEEGARGDPAAAAGVRQRLEARIGGGLRQVSPGTPEAQQLKAALIEEGLWSQYLEVAIGPDAEIFTKAPVLASVGWGAEVGIRSDSDWNNPEPEVVLVVAPNGRCVGATLGNDVNLRDFEGRSALLLGKAKDNNASCAIGPFIRLFDASFTMDDVRSARVELSIRGDDGCLLQGVSNMSQISRDPEDLIAQALSEHQYPDGFCLFLGTLFAPVQDRDHPGRGFTHKVGDLVSISSARFGSLVNRVTTSRDAPPWTLGLGGLMGNLAARGLLNKA